MRNHFLCAVAMFCAAPLALSAAEVIPAPLGPVSAREFGVPPNAPSPFDRLPPAAVEPARPTYPVYVAQNTAPEGTANFLTPDVAAMTMQNPLPPAPPSVSSGAVPVNEARPLPPPSAPYPVPSQAVVPTLSAPPAPAYAAPAYAAPGGNVPLQAPPAAGDGRSNTVPFVVPVQIPPPGDWGQAPHPQPNQAAWPGRAMSPVSDTYLDFSSLPYDSVILVTPSQVKQAVMRGERLIVLDVRAELVRDVEGHVIGDVNVEYLPSETFAARVAAVIPDRSIPVVVYCHDGIWSAKAAADLLRAGYRVFHAGAFNLWL